MGLPPIDTAVPVSIRSRPALAVGDAYCVMLMFAVAVPEQEPGFVTVTKYEPAVAIFIVPALELKLFGPDQEYADPVGLVDKVTESPGQNPDPEEMIYTVGCPFMVTVPVEEAEQLLLLVTVTM